jgi:hypothetical protein
MTGDVGGTSEVVVEAAASPGGFASPAGGIGLRVAEGCDPAITE